MTTPTNHTPAKFEFISNPFKSSFDGLSKLFKLNQTPAVVIMIIALFGGLLNSISSLPGSSTDSSTAPVDENVSMTIVAIIIAVALVIAVVATVLGAIYTGVVNYVAWKTSRNESTDLGEAFEQTMKRFWRILLIQIIVGFKIFFGFIFFIVPGIRAALRYQMVYITMFDEDLNTWKSMDRVKFLTKNHLMEVYGIYTVSQLLFPIAILIQMGGEAILYPQLKHLKDNDLPKPPTHWLNYLGLLLMSLFLLFIAFILVIVALVVSSN